MALLLYRYRHALRLNFTMLRNLCWTLSLTWAPTVQAGPASEKLRGKGYAFYHNKAPEYSDPLSAIS